MHQRRSGGDNLNEALEGEELWVETENVETSVKQIIFLKQIYVKNLYLFALIFPNKYRNRFFNYPKILK